MMKTHYLVPQTETINLLGENLMQFPVSPEVHPAPGRDGFAPGGGDLGGIPAA